MVKWKSFFLAVPASRHIIGGMHGFKAATWLLALMPIALAGAWADEAVVARVKSDRVNLRARAELSAEVVAQAGVDERLPVKSVGQDWVEVVPPDRVDLWVHRDFVKDGVSTVDKLNVRAGASVNYSIVGSYARGEKVEVRGQFGEWLKVAPANASVWVSRELVDLVYPVGAREPPPAPVAAAPLPATEAPLASPAISLDAAASRALPAESPALPPPPDLHLVPLEGQGLQVQREGELKPAPFVFGRPSKFRLVRRSGALLETICYVRGNSAQLSGLLNQNLIIRGREYWVQGVKQPVVVLERIERRAP